MSSQKKALVSWIGQADLNASEKNKDGEDGPILSTLKKQPHEEVFLLFNYPDSKIAKYCKWLDDHTTTKVNPPKKADIRSPVHFGDIYQESRKYLDEIKNRFPLDEMSLLITSGTPVMQTVWILLGKGLYPMQMFTSSIEEGVQIADIPFDISSEFVERIKYESEAKTRRLASGKEFDNSGFENIITQSPNMYKQITLAKKLAKYNHPILIMGSSGTGKELFARAIHAESDRAEHNNGNPITVNCGAIPSELVDSELFGYVKGAFTGANSNKDGYFSAADGGTIFLDEFGELPKDTQVRLLRVLQDGTFQRVGCTVEKKVDVRVIAATNRNLLKEVSEGHFREDLFYRIAVGIIDLPSLKKRPGDVALLTEELLKNIDKDKKISPNARNIIISHSWPGNVRELQAVLTRANFYSIGDTIEEEDMSNALLKIPAKENTLLPQKLDEVIDIEGLIKNYKKHFIKIALAQTSGNKTQAAKLLGLKNYQTLSNWIDDVGLNV